MLGWPGRACAAIAEHGHAVTYYNLGVRGDTTADVLRRWQTECECRLSPQSSGALVFGFGLNDSVRDDAGQSRVDWTTTSHAAREILRSAAAWRPTLLVGPAPVIDGPAPRPVGGRQWYLSQEAIELMASRLEILAAEEGVPFLNLSNSLADSAAWREDLEKSDCVHPTSAGYDLIAEKVIEWAEFLALFQRE
jgi:acyl-CoA thioesterase I